MGNTLQNAEMEVLQTELWWVNATKKNAPSIQFYRDEIPVVICALSVIALYV